jgi:hypothetical protein
MSCCIINPYRFATATVTDPSFSNTVLLLGAEDAGSPFVDESAAAHGAASSGNSPSHDTTIFLFGPRSIRFNSAGNDNLEWTDSADWTKGTSDFTDELFFNLSNVTTTQHFLAHYNGTGNQRGWTFTISAGSIIFQATASGSVAVTSIVSGALSPSTNTWYYACVERSGNTFRVYGGPAGGTASMLGKATNAINIFDSTAQLRVSGLPGGSQNIIGGNLDEIRMTKNTARYNTDAGYPVPTAAFPRS